MRKIKMMACAVAISVLGVDAFAIFSAPVLVDTSSGNKHWSTVFTNAVPLRWEWSPEATHAQLEIVGMNSSFTTNFNSVVSNCIWQAFVTDQPSEEDVYDLTLTFYDGSEAVLDSLSAQLAVIAGAFGGTAVDSVGDSLSWSKVNGNVVIPYDGVWTGETSTVANARLVITKQGGMTQTNSFDSMSGYYGWKIQNSTWGYGTFDLSLTFEGSSEEWTAVLTRLVAGTVILVR